MRLKPILILMGAVLCRYDLYGAQSSQPQLGGSALQASNILNPNISVIGWFQGEAGHRVSPVESSDLKSFRLKEAEIAFQSVVDPYARADFFVSANDEGETEIEEGYLTWFSLPYDLSLKVGKFKANFGKFNRIHTPETAFADRPLAHDNFLFREGIAGVGGSLSWQIPNPWLFLNLDAETMTTPHEWFETLEGKFNENKRRRLMYIGRLSAYHDLTEATNITFGASYLNSLAGVTVKSVSIGGGVASTTAYERGTSHLYGLDLTLRWKNPRRAIYRSLVWQTEAIWNKIELDTFKYKTRSPGLFSHLEYQFARRWRAGGRYDWSESPADNSKHESGGLVYLTFTPSEFSLVSLQGKQVKRIDGEKETLGFLKVTFNIGPHGAHPF